MDPKLEIAIRIAAYAAAFAVLAAWEVLAPRRELTVGRKPRWPNNLGILVVDALAVRVIVPTAAVGFAILQPALARSRRPDGHQLDALWRQERRARCESLADGPVEEVPRGLQEVPVRVGTFPCARLGLGALTPRQASGSENGTPSSMRSAPPRSTAATSRAVIAGFGSPAVR